MEVFPRDDQIGPVRDDVQLLAGYRALVQEGQQVRRRYLALEEKDVALARDADDRAWHPGRTLPYHRSIGRWIRTRRRTGGCACIYGDPLFLRELDGLRVQHLRACLGHLLR